MPDLDLLAAAYDGGRQAGRALRWMILLVAGLALAIRIARGTWGPGSRTSPLATGLALAAVVIGLVGSVYYDFGDRSAAHAAQFDMTAARAEVVRGCFDQGQSPSVCECYGEEVLRRTDYRPERFAALEREMIAREKAGQDPPELIVEAAQDCAGTAG